MATISFCRCFAENDGTAKTRASTRILHTKYILIEWVRLLLCAVVSGRMNIFGFCCFARDHGTGESQRKGSILENREREWAEKNCNVVNPISFGVNCDSSRTTVFDIWMFPQNYPIILWNDVRTHIARRFTPPEKDIHFFFFSFRLHLFAMMSFRSTDRAHSQTVTDLWCRRPQYGGRCGEVSIIRYPRSLSRRSRLQLMAAVWKHAIIQQPIYHFQRAKDFCHPFNISHWNCKYHCIKWDTMDGTHDSHAPTLAYRGELGQCSRCMLLYSNQFISIPWQTIHKTLSVPN